MKLYLALPVLVCAVVASAHAAAATTKTSTMLPASDVQTALKTGVSTALTSSYSAVLSATSTGMVCNGSTTLNADGNTPDTDGLIAAIAAASTLTQGAEIVLPTGDCELNREIDVPVSASLRFTGAGIGLTRLEFFTVPGNPTPVGNGLVFTVSNNANLTIDDFTIARRLGANNQGNPFIGTAITVASASDTTSGNVITTNLDIIPPWANDQQDGWNTGLLETNIVDPMISNVMITMPGWAGMQDPSGYTCTAGSNTMPCAIHALPSPANPISTPAGLGFGTATGVALHGSGGGNFAIDSVIDGLTVTGGMVGLDLAIFQGAYVSDAKFASNVYGIRADTAATTSELLSVTNSLFTDAVSGIYTNGIGGMQITGNYIQPGNAGTANLPDWSAIWARNDNDTTISDNNIIGSGTDTQPEYGIWLSADVYNGFPASITGNTIYSLSTPGSICLGNNANMTSINATGNSLFSCANYLQDQQGGNAYGSNSFQTPDMYDNGQDDVTFPNSLAIGTFHSTGTLAMYNFSKETFSVDATGDVAASGNLAVSGAVTANGSITASAFNTPGQLVFSSAKTGYKGATQLVGNFYFPYKGNPTTIPLNPLSGSFPAFTGGIATIFGELTCFSNNGYVASWHIDGHYAYINKAPSLMAFNASLEADKDSQTFGAASSGTFSVTPSAIASGPGVQVTFGSSVANTWDCTSMLNEMITN